MGIFNKTLAIVGALFFILTVVFAVMAWYYHYDSKNKTIKIDKLKTEKVVIEATNKVTQFENNQTIIMQKEKEVQDEIIDDNIGTHTIHIP